MTYEEIVSLAEKNFKKTKAKKIESNAAVEFDIYGEGEGAFYVELKEGTVSVAPFEYYNYDAKACVSGEEIVGILNGEKSYKESIEDGSLRVEGELKAVETVFGLLSTPTAKSDKTEKKTATKKAPTKRSVKVEKKIVEETKKSKSKIAEDIKK